MASLGMANDPLDAPSLCGEGLSHSGVALSGAHAAPPGTPALNPALPGIRGCQRGRAHASRLVGPGAHARPSDPSDGPDPQLLCGTSDPQELIAPCMGGKPGTPSAHWVLLPFPQTEACCFTGGSGPTPKIEVPAEAVPAAGSGGPPNLASACRRGCRCLTPTLPPSVPPSHENTSHMDLSRVTSS